jgi:alkanesulfonate monooxygenase SsuD/methylene tetrahydromethanopterin reductase-like flavin-dependent oxidoreductase (luciferase family)
VLREHCERLGRPYDDITKTAYTMVVIGRDEAEVAAKRERLAEYIPKRGWVVGTPDQLIEELAAFARSGCQQVIFRMPDWADVEPVQRFAERVIPALASA